MGIYEGMRKEDRRTEERRSISRWWGRGEGKQVRESRGENEDDRKED